MATAVATAVAEMEADMKDETIYSDQQKANINPDVAKWEKSNTKVETSVEKKPEDVVEKTMQSLSERGKEAAASKTATAKTIRYKGALYVKATADYIERLDEFNSWLGENENNLPKYKGTRLFSIWSKDVYLFSYLDEANAKDAVKQFAAGGFEPYGPYKDGDNYTVGVYVGWSPNDNPEHSKWLEQHGFKLKESQSGELTVVKASAKKLIRFKGSLYRRAEQPGTFVPNAGSPPGKAPTNELNSWQNRQKAPNIDSVTWSPKHDKTMDLIDTSRSEVKDVEQTMDLIDKAATVIRYKGATYRLANPRKDRARAGSQLRHKIAEKASTEVVAQLKKEGFHPREKEVGYTGNNWARVEETLSQLIFFKLGNMTKYSHPEDDEI